MTSTRYVIAGEHGYLGDPGRDLMDSRFSEPLYDWTAAELAWQFVTIEKAVSVIRELKGTAKFAGCELYVCPVDV